MKTQSKTFSILAGLALVAGLVFYAPASSAQAPAKPATPPAAQKSVPPAPPADGAKRERMRPPREVPEAFFLDLPLLELPPIEPLPMELIAPALADVPRRLLLAEEALAAMPPLPPMFDMPALPPVGAMLLDMPAIPPVPPIAEFYARESAMLAWSEQSRPPGESAREREDELKQREQERKDREREREQQRRERESELYEDGREALEEARYDRALDRFARVVEMNGQRADGALYWKAYTLNKVGRRDEALTSLEQLKKGYPQSRWLGDAKALEVEVQQNQGKPVPAGDADDCETKLLIINGMMHTEPARAVPILTKFLQSSQCPKAKRQALFVLAQANNEEARDTLAKIARGESNPDLQRSAIQYLGIHGGREGVATLAKIYDATSDVDSKKRILNAFMVAGDKDKLFNAAKNEKDPQLRKSAIHWLGTMSADTELWQLWTTESDVDVKKQILHSFFIGGRVDRLVEIARTEKDPSLRKSAIHNLGISGKKAGGDVLAQIYSSEQDPSVKKQVLHALFLQQNATSLIAIARKETDTDLKKQAIHWLSLINSKEATDFLMELLNK